MTEKGTLPNEEAAERLTNIAGWVCKTCRRFFGDDATAETVARYCCEKDHECGTKGCAGRAEKPYIYCDACLKQRAEARYMALPEVEWDGETPLCVFDDDTYFFDVDSLADDLAENETPLEKARLVLCEEDSKPHFSMDDFVSDYVGEHDGVDATNRIDLVVNRWIEKHVPTMWVAGKSRPSLASLKMHVPQPDDTEKQEAAGA